MATSYKILGQSAPANTSVATLYTVPAETEAIVSTITVTNVSATDTTFRVFVVADGGTAGTTNAIAYDAPLTANSFVAFTLGLTLGAADTIQVRTSTADAVAFQAFGSELS